MTKHAYTQSQLLDMVKDGETVTQMMTSPGWKLMIDEHNKATQQAFQALCDTNWFTEIIFFPQFFKFLKYRSDMNARNDFIKRAQAIAAKGELARIELAKFQKQQ